MLSVVHSRLVSNVKRQCVGGILNYKYYRVVIR